MNVTFSGINKPVLRNRKSANLEPDNLSNFEDWALPKFGAFGNLIT